MLSQVVASEQALTSGIRIFALAPGVVDTAMQAEIRKADPANWRVAKSIFVADDEATARTYAKDDGGPYHFYFKQMVRKLVGNGRPELFKHDRSLPDSAITIDYVLDSLVICGTVNSVVDQLLAFREKIGDFGTLLYAGHDWVDARLGKRSMELMEIGRASCRERVYVLV